MSLLKQNTIKKKQVDENNVIELNTGNNSNEYKLEIIYNSTVYIIKLASYLLELYYLIF